MRNDDPTLEWILTDDGRRVQIVKDGGSVRTTMSARDARSVDADPLRITDDSGSTDGLHRPGWRIATGGSAGDIIQRDIQHELIEEARAEYLDGLTNAWKGN